MFCINCGKKLEADEKFCSVCGTRVEQANPNMNGQVIYNPVVNKKNNLPLIIVGIIVLVVAVMFVVPFDSEPSNPAVGTWDCKSFYSAYENDDAEFIVTMKLNNDNKFLWSKYGDEVNNHVIGSYTFEDLEKTNNSGEYSYYNIKLTSEEYIVDGELQNEDYISEYEIGISNDEAILMNVKTYNMYYCYRSSQDSPDIKINN